MYHAVLNIVCFQTFSEKHKENVFHRKYRLFEGPGENLSSPTISQINKIYDFMSFTKPWSRASEARFFKFLKNKI